MTDKHEALIFADDRRTSSGDDLYEWAIDAEDWIRRLHAENETLRAAAQAVIDRWDTPLWKDVEPTAAVIGRLRAAVASEQTSARGES